MVQSLPWKLYSLHSWSFILWTRKFVTYSQKQTNWTISCVSWIQSTFCVIFFWTLYDPPM